VAHILNFAITRSAQLAKIRAQKHRGSLKFSFYQKWLKLALLQTDANNAEITKKIKIFMVRPVIGPIVLTVHFAEKS
jgi:hypothetical protein